MKLTESQIKKISEKILASSKENCGHCGNKLQLNDSVFELREFTPGDNASASSLFPVVVLTCKECGNTQMFSAVFLGVFGHLPTKKSNE